MYKITRVKNIPLWLTFKNYSKKEKSQAASNNNYKMNIVCDENSGYVFLNSLKVYLQKLYKS